MNLDHTTAVGFTPYELSPNNTLLTMSRDAARASMQRHSLAMAARWLAMTAGGMGALAFPLAVGVTGLLRRCVSTCSTRPNTASRNASCSAETRALLAHRGARSTSQRSSCPNCLALTMA